MSFSGSVESESHEGGLLVAFEGRAPRLGASIRVIGGKPLGRVNTVIGAPDRALIHIHPLVGDIDASSAIGSPVEIAPRERRSRDQNRGRFDRQDSRRGRDGGRGGYDRGGNRDRRGQDRGRGGQDGNRGGDWDCPKCKNSNFAFRTECNRCETAKPQGGGGGSNHQRGRNDGRGRDRSDGRGRDRSDGRGRDRNDGNRGGDWTCPKCKNSNFAFRNKCNRCEADKPSGGGGGRSNRDRQDSKDRPPRKQSREGDRRGPRGGDRRGFRDGDSRQGGNSRGRSPGSANRPRRGGFRGPTGGGNRRNRPGRSSGRR